jgi:hypothetical protein
MRCSAGLAGLLPEATLTRFPEPEKPAAPQTEGGDRGRPAPTEQITQPSPRSAQVETRGRTVPTRHSTRVPRSACPARRASAEGWLTGGPPAS